MRHSPPRFAQLLRRWLQMSGRGIQKSQDWITRPQSRRVMTRETGSPEPD
ncbi:MAG: hypothetical protein ORN98_05625 [Alphaproteobacteria bacterium]|nr:hypothetical protein [Alphaproteobacteria bacterium]